MIARPRLFTRKRIISIYSLAYLTSTQCSHLLFRVNRARFYSHLTHRAPAATPKWFYAVDIADSKPDWAGYKREKDPEKFLAFAPYDLERLENAFQSFTKHGEPAFVEVNEDRLFQVDLEKFRILPVYWEGPVFEVRRAIWFTTDGCPLPMDLAASIESGYKTIMPYRFNKKNVNARKTLGMNSEIRREPLVETNSRKKPAPDTSENAAVNIDEELDLAPVNKDKLVLFFDQLNAALIPKSYATPFHLKAIRNFGAGLALLMSVTPIRRGFSNTEKLVLDKLPSNPVGKFFKDENDEPVSAHATTKLANEQEGEASDPSHADFDRQVSALKSDRPVDHLILCVHGIGQILGHRYESVNFAHSVNVLRSKMKAEFRGSRSMRKLVYDENIDSEEKKSNNRVQILPVSWRHKIDFHPQQSSAVFDDKGHNRLPSLSQLNVDGVKPLRNLMGDVVLDILLYYEPKYASKLFKAVTSELNRVYDLYMERHPDFDGKVHVLGHSLGSAIVFDILSRQPGTFSENSDRDHHLRFDVDALFCIGSPVGAFKLLEQRNIVASKRRPPSYDPAATPGMEVSPKCRNLYNIFHLCDPVAYRMEPLVSPRYHEMKPETIPASSKSIFNDQIADIGDGITEKINQASSWFGSSKKEAGPNRNQSPGSADAQENPLKELISSIAFSDLSNGEEHIVEKEIEGKELSPLLDLNRTGRVDYALKAGVFQISLVSALSAHVSYFEDDDTAAFILKQVLTSEDDKVKVKKVEIQQ